MNVDRAHAAACADTLDRRASRDRALAKSGPRLDTVATPFPRRPGPGVLNEAIPLFYIARNKIGLWVARASDGQAGGIFLLKRSALRFAKKHSTAGACATMLLSDRIDLDIQNRGNRLVAVIAVVIATARKLIAGEGLCGAGRRLIGQYRD